MALAKSNAPPRKQMPVLAANDQRNASLPNQGMSWSLKDPMMRGPKPAPHKIKPKLNKAKPEALRCGAIKPASEAYTGAAHQTAVKPNKT